MRMTLGKREPPTRITLGFASSANLADYVSALPSDDAPQIDCWYAPEEPDWERLAGRELIAAAHRAEQDYDRQKKRYAGGPICLLPHPTLLSKAWAMKQLHAFPDGTPQRAGTLPRLKWTGGGVLPQRTERDGNARRYAGKKRFS